jgi:hypothetical protein
VHGLECIYKLYILKFLASSGLGLRVVLDFGMLPAEVLVSIQVLNLIDAIRVHMQSGNLDAWLAWLG